MKSELSTNRRILLIGRMIVVFVGCLFLFPLCLGSAAAQSVPQLVNYQGMLTDDGGIELPTKEYELRFSIYTEAMGGTPVWGPQVFDGDPGIGHGAKVPVVQGHFNVILGPKDVWAKNITEAFVSEKTYLEITVNGSSPITPRQQILSTPYALNGVPAGSINAFAGPNIPPGWLLCDGRALSSQKYPALFVAIETGWGNGTDDADPETDFNLPDLGGRFLRGVDGGLGRDPDSGSRTPSRPGGKSGDDVGSIQPDGYGDHGHDVHDPGHHHAIKYGSWASHNDWGCAVKSADCNKGWIDSNSHISTKTTGISIINSGGEETRPKNVNVNFIIKY